MEVSHHLVNLLLIFLIARMKELAVYEVGALEGGGSEPGEGAYLEKKRNTHKSREVNVFEAGEADPICDHFLDCAFIHGDDGFHRCQAGKSVRDKGIQDAKNTC